MLPFYNAAAPAGLERAVRWIAARRRGWRAAQANRVFLAGLVGMAALITLAVFGRRVVGADLANPAWNEADAAYEAAGQWLAAAGDRASVVVANNPPAFYYFTGHPSIVTPNGDVETLLAAAGRFRAAWIVLDANVPDGLVDLYIERESSDCLRLRATFSDSEARPVYLYVVTCV